MAIIIRNTGGDPGTNALAIAQNLEAQSSSAVGTSFFHADSSSFGAPETAFNVPGLPTGQLITQSLSVDLLSGIQLALAISGALIGGGATAEPPAHFYDAPANSVVQAGAHKTQDAVNTNLLGARNTFLASAQDQTAANTFANAIKNAFNAHLTQSNVHYNNDTTNTEATANASDATTFKALVNSLRNRVNNHVSGTNPAYPQIRVIPA